MDAAFSELKRLERLLDFYSPTSEISKINKGSGGVPVSVTPTTFTLINTALKVSELTDGAFDITLGVINRRYDFIKKTHPTPQEIKSLLPLVGYKNIVVNPSLRVVFLKKQGMMIDPGGITKGYAADRAVEVLRAQGIKAALVAVAGDIKAYGLKPDGRAWLVGIRDPRSRDTEQVFATLRLKDMAVSTSGDYERYFIEKGVRYHHILDPKTGMPARGVISVTVVGPEAVYTDSLATACFVKGVKEGMKMVERNGYMAVVVDSSGAIHYSAGLKDKLELIKRHIEVRD
jgi:thiamine biosynthesis lipoprotein